MRILIVGCFLILLALTPVTDVISDADLEGFNVSDPISGAGGELQSVRRLVVLADGSILLEDFESDPVGALPASWFNRDGDAIPAYFEGDLREAYQYAIMEDSMGRFLRFDGTKAKHLNFPLADKPMIDLSRTPFLEWRWRVHEIPEGASEDEDRLNDTAASVYIVFKMNKVLFRRVPQTIRYTWSSSIPEGTVLDKFFGNQKVVVMGSGGDGLGEWHTIRVNLVEDYRRLYGEDPPAQPLALLILSDANDTGTKAVADYDDFRLLPAKAKTAR